LTGSSRQRSSTRQAARQASRARKLDAFGEIARS
jgi:hypothetical protein